MKITSDIKIDKGEIQLQFVRASGPGGQRVNKVSTAVQLRFDVANSPSLTDTIRERLRVLFGNRINADGILIIKAKRFRSQEKNCKDAYNKLVNIIRKAACPSKRRLQTAVSLASRKKRLDDKRHRSMVKQLRKPVLPGQY